MDSFANASESTSWLENRFEEPRSVGGKERLKPTGYGAWQALADRERVDPGNRHDFHAGIGQETFFGLAKGSDLVLALFNG
jgi:hypothetical protein